MGPKDKKDPRYRKISKVMHQVGIGLKVNMYSMVVTNKLMEVKLLERSPSNDRMLAQRPEGFQKNAAIRLLTDDDRNSFPNWIGEFGKAWAEKFKGDVNMFGNALPTLNEMLEGLMQWYARQV